MQRGWYLEFYHGVSSEFNHSDIKIHSEYLGIDIYTSKEVAKERAKKKFAEIKCLYINSRNEYLVWKEIHLL